MEMRANMMKMKQCPDHAADTRCLDRKSSQRSPALRPLRLEDTGSDSGVAGYYDG